MANGVSPWLHINGGYSDLFDRRGLAPMKEVFQRLERWEQYLDGAQSQARVVLVLSRYTQDNHGRDKPQERYLNFVRGWYLALQEAHIPFDVISDKLLSPERLQRYGVVVISNLACVSNAAVAALQQVQAELRESRARTEGLAEPDKTVRCSEQSSGTST